MKWKFGKKLLGVLAAGMVALGSVPMTAVPVSAADYTYGDLTYRFLDGTIEITDCDASLTSVEIPAEIEGVRVTSIGDHAFSYCTSLTDVYYSGTEAQWNTIDIGGFNETLRTATIHFSDGTTKTTYTTGDLDGDNTITTSDAYNALLAYSQVTAGGTSDLTAVQEAAADIDGDGSLTTNDAFLILQYYSIHAAGGDITWEELLA